MNDKEWQKTMKNTRISPWYRRLYRWLERKLK